jgi:hypothetical protein
MKTIILLTAALIALPSGLMAQDVDTDAWHASFDNPAPNPQETLSEADGKPSAAEDQEKVVDKTFAYKKIKRAPGTANQNSIIEDFPGLKGYWIHGSSTSVDTIKTFNRLNYAGALVLLSGLQSTKAECKKGTLITSTLLWNTLDENEKDFAFDVLGLTMMKCKATKPIPVLPPTYLSTLKKVEQLYTANTDKRDIYFMYPLLAAANMINGSEKAAKNILSKIQTSCDSEGQVHSARTGECWQTFDDSLLENSERIYAMLDDIREIIESHGVYYEKGLYEKIRLQSQEYKGKSVEFTITISSIFPGIKENYIGGYVGSFSSKPQMHSQPGPSFGTMYTEFDEETSKQSTSRIKIGVPSLLSDVLTNLKQGDIITVKGKANGLSLWNENIGYVPLVSAEKVVAN